MRKIQKSVEKQFKFHKAWKTVSKYVNIGIIRQLDAAMVEFFSKIEDNSEGYGLFDLGWDLDSEDDFKEKYFDPIHIAAFTGNTSLWKALTKRVKNSQPSDHYGRKPLHYSAAGGQLKICQLTINHGEDQR